MINNNTDLNIDQLYLIKNIFTIAINNVTGLSEPIKQAQIIDLIIENHIEIFSLSKINIFF